MSKNVYGFKCNLDLVCGWGNRWKASGWVKNKFYIVDGLFLSFSKRQIERSLKNKILAKANGLGV